jgi:hypothetical protein
MKLLFILFLLVSTITTTSIAQIINGYARVTAIAGRVFDVASVNEGGDTFEDDEWVVVMQMQDDVIGETGDVVGFGDLGDIQSAGLYEIRQIESHTEVSGVPATITLKNPTNNTYNICANCRVQLITFPTLGAPDYTTTADLVARAWNGNRGGVLAFNVDGTLTLNHNLDADQAGFRGADANAGGSSGCDGSANFRVASTANSADKGEGIFRRTAANQAAGRARILSGGGGGNSHNAGGGGGGNYSEGGMGGPGWPTCSPSAGGIGGISLSSEISVSRVFMGGGGGAGEGNNDYATDGADGGGIILVKANEIATDACSDVTISANGASILIAPGNDGGGGGGAGGSIVLEVETWSIIGSCPLTVEANGGDGGAVGSGATHGGGGGGGQGVVFYSSTLPSTNVTTTTNNGSGGCNNSSVPCNSRAADGSGTDGDGIFDIETGPLPVTIVSFTGHFIDDKVLLNWVSKSEQNNAYYTIEHSINGLEWYEIKRVEGAGNSVVKITYDALHESPRIGLNYYRLHQTDFDGTSEIVGMTSLIYASDDALLYPNPAKASVTIAKQNIDFYQIEIRDILGKLHKAKILEMDTEKALIDLSNLTKGIYYIRLSHNEQIEVHQLVVQ